MSPNNSSSPDTLSSCDPFGLEYPELIKKLVDMLPHKGQITILVPGVGGGKVVRELLDSLEDREIVLIAIDKEKKSVEEFIGNLVSAKWETSTPRNSSEKSLIFSRNKSRIELYETTVEQYLIENDFREAHFDLIMCLLFFHYVPYSSISILKKLYELLKPTGIFLVDRLCGKDSSSQNLFKALDCQYETIRSLNIQDEGCLSWRNFYLTRLKQQGAYWGSIIKATDIRIVSQALKPLFRDYVTCESKPFTYNLGLRHLPWCWAGQNDNKDDLELLKKIPDKFKTIPAKYKFYIFANKKEEKFGDSYEMYWNIIKQTAVLKSLETMNSILWSLKESQRPNSRDTEHFTNFTLPSVIVQLIASSGILNYNTKIGSIFIASGSLPDTLGLTKLRGLHILVNNSNGEGEEYSQAWLKNYILYTNVLKQSLSESFIDTGKKIALLINSLPSVELINSLELLKEFEFDHIKIPLSEITNSVKNIRFSPPVERNLLLWNLLEINSEQGVNHAPEDYTVLKDWNDNIKSDLSDAELKSLEGVLLNLNSNNPDHAAKRYLQINEEVAKSYLPVTLLRSLGNILFIPLPSYFEYKINNESSAGTNNYKTRGILGLGIIAKSPLDRQLFDELGYIHKLAENLMRRLQDNYLSLKWIRDAQFAALRSAIAAIMGRNMSHNIGSHVLARLSTSQSIKKSLGGYQYSLFDGSTDCIAELNAFLRMRMDFVADISTAQQPPSPTNVSLIAEIMEQFVKQKLLWDNLCASHGLEAKDIQFRIFVENNSVITATAEKKAGSPDEFLSPGTWGLDRELSVIQIGVPNGGIGCQSFYCILENFVRNSVKHSMRPDKGRLEIFIRVETEGLWKDNDRLIRVTIFDNLEKCISDTKNLEGAVSLEDRLNAKLQEPLISAEGTLSASNRGLKEMKAAAAYLRGLSAESIDDPKVEPPLLVAKNINGSVGYELFLLRPKDLFIYNTQLENLPQMEVLSLKKQGVEIFNKNDTTELCVRAAEYSLLFVNDVDKEFFSELSTIKYTANLPLRILVQDIDSVNAYYGSWTANMSTLDVQDILDNIELSLKNGQGKSAIKFAWELWIKLICQGAKRQLWNLENKPEWNFEGVSYSIKEQQAIDLSKDIDKNTKTVLYARHGYKGKTDNIIFYEPCRGGVDPISFTLANPPLDKDARLALVYQLIEASLLPVVIIDERVQEAAQTVKYQLSEDRDDDAEREMLSWLHDMRVYIPSKNELDLESKSNTLTKEKIENWFTTYIDTLQNLEIYPLLVIHQGVLDIIGLQNANESQEWIDKLKTRKQFSEVIVTSGRGIPDTIAGNARFTPLSTVLLYTVERKSKFHLVQALASARGTKK